MDVRQCMFVYLPDLVGILDVFVGEWVALDARVESQDDQSKETGHGLRYNHRRDVQQHRSTRSDIEYRLIKRYLMWRLLLTLKATACVTV